MPMNHLLKGQYNDEEFYIGCTSVLGNILLPSTSQVIAEHSSPGLKVMR